MHKIVMENTTANTLLLEDKGLILKFTIYYHERNTFMKRCLIILIICFSLFILGCSTDVGEKLDESEVGVLTSESEEITSDISLSMDVVEENDKKGIIIWEQMTQCIAEEKKESLLKFESIFSEEKEFLLSVSGEEQTQIVTYSKINNFVKENQNHDFEILEKFVLLDMNGDGMDELILCFEGELENDYLILGREDEKYYCSYHPNNRMRFLDETGLYTVGDGVSVAGFMRIEFDNRIVENEIACWKIEQDYENWEIRFVGTVAGEPVTENAFSQWEDENVKEEAEWIIIKQDENQTESLITEREALDLAYKFYYEGSDLEKYSVFCEEVPHSSIPQMGYVVVQYGDTGTGYEKYTPGNIDIENDKIIMIYKDISESGNYYVFWLYQYISEGEEDYKLSTLDYIAVSVDGNEVFSERLDENGNYLSDPEQWNTIE